MNNVDPVEVTLAVQVHRTTVAVHLQIKNRGNHPVLIEQINPNFPSPLPHEFEVTSDDKEIAYIGPMIKRIPYSRDDFRWLQPSAEIVRNLNIGDLFNFLPGHHEYKIIHTHLRYDEASGKITEHVSSPSFFKVFVDLPNS